MVFQEQLREVEKKVLKKIILHHQKQRPTGPIIEIPRSKHSIGNKSQHPHDSKKGAGVGSGEVRRDFNNWRLEYWKNRAKEELTKRGKSCI